MCVSWIIVRYNLPVFVTGLEGVVDVVVVVVVVLDGVVVVVSSQAH